MYARTKQNRSLFLIGDAVQKSCLPSVSRIVEGEGAVAGAVWCSGQSPSSAFLEPLAVATPLPLTSKNEIVSGTDGGRRGCGPRISEGSIVVVLIPPSEAPEPLVLLPSVDVGSG